MCCQIRNEPKRKEEVGLVGRTFKRIEKKEGEKGETMRSYKISTIPAKSIRFYILFFSHCMCMIVYFHD